MNQDIFLKQMDSLINESKKFHRYKRQGDYGDYYSQVPEVELIDFLTRVEAIIERLSPQNSAYRKNLLKITFNEHSSDRLDPYIGILKALRCDFSEGYLQPLLELMHAELFSNFLEMAAHLIEQGFKDPDAVITGSVLEEHLRKLCDKSGIDTKKQDGSPKKSDSLNSELAGVSVYSKLDQKNVTAWLDLRNKAAHGHYSEYTKDQVVLLIQSVRDFITRNSA